MHDVGEDRDDLSEITDLRLTLPSLSSRELTDEASNVYDVFHESPQSLIV